MRYCHKHQVVHRDIKLENLLWEHPGDNAEPQVKAAFSTTAGPAADEPFIAEFVCLSVCLCLPFCLAVPGYLWIALREMCYCRVLRRCFAFFVFGVGRANRLAGARMPAAASTVAQR